MASGTQLQLQAIPDSGASFNGWSGACSGSVTACQITAISDTSVTAAFSRPGPVQLPPPAIGRRLSVMVLVANDGTNLPGIALNSTQVFFGRRTAEGSSSIWAVPKTGGNPVRISSGLPVYIVADDSFVYWTDQQAVYSAPASGGPPSQLFAGAFLETLALDEQGALYFAELRDFYQPRGIHRMQDRVDSVIAADQSPMGGIAVDETWTYYTSATFSGEQSVRRVPRHGGAVQILARPSAAPTTIKVDSRNAYFRDLLGAVWSIAKAGGAPVLLSGQNTGGGADGFDLDVNGSTVWWIGYGFPRLNGLFRANEGGTAFTGVHVDDDFNWSGPRVDDGAVYYFHAGSLLKRLK
jgi:hypothetical protein